MTNKKKFFFILIIMMFGLVNVNLTNKKNADVDYIPYYLKVYEADSLFVIKDYNKSYKILDSLFNYYAPSNCFLAEIETYIKAAYLTDQKEKKYKKYALELVSVYGKKLHTIEKDKQLSKVYKKLNINSEEIEKLEKEYISHLDWELLDTLKNIQERDQVYRLKYDNDKGFDNPKTLVNMMKADSINEVRMRTLFESNKFPSCKEGVGSTDLINNEFFHLGAVLLHTKDSVRIHYFLPQVMKFVKSGKCDPIHYAEMVDQYNLYNGKKQVYGTYKDYRKGKLVLSPTQYDRKKTNEIRKSIGLPSLTYDAWKFEKENGITEEEYILKNFKPKIN